MPKATKNKTIIFCFFQFILLFSVHAQNQIEGEKELPLPPEILRKGLEKNNYLAPFLQLKSREGEYLGSEEMRVLYLETMVLLCSYTNLHQDAYQYEDKLLEIFNQSNQSRTRNVKDTTSAPFDRFQPQTALDQIVSMADKHQVLMINEEHRTSLHRAMTLQLLPFLYAKGFRYFAAETLNESDKELNKRGFPTQKTGYYTADPVYGDVIRTALKLGYTVIPYDLSPKNCGSPPQCQDARERGMAQNLYDRILRNNPKAKIFVHVGRSHNAKIKVEGQFALMGWHFRDIAKIEPFVIDQLTMSPRQNPADEKPLYRYAEKKWKFSEPIVFQSENGEFWTPSKDQADLVIFHPRIKYKNGRPIWLEMNGLRKIVTPNSNKLGVRIKNRLFRGTKPMIIQAFVSGETEDSIPVDQFIIFPNKTIPSLILPKGKFLVVVKDEEGNTGGKYFVNVI